MTNSKTLVCSALAAAATLIAAVPASAGPAAQPEFSFEKCYGVARAGQNDCQTATHSCAGTATADAQGNSWIYLPAGTCARIVGSSSKPSA